MSYTVSVLLSCVKRLSGRREDREIEMSVKDGIGEGERKVRSTDNSATMGSVDYSYD